MGLRVVILGRGEMLLNLIRGSMLASAEIVGVFRYERLIVPPLFLKFYDFFKSSPALTFTKKHKIYDIPFTSANSENFKRFLVKENVDVVLVGSWCEKLKKEIIDIPVIGTVNVHPSLLPQYRGPNPYLQTILHGEKKSGVTFHLMTEKYDAGPVLAQKEIEILQGDTGKELKNKTVFQARLLCANLLEKLEGGFVIPVEQDESLATYYENVKPEDMTLDFQNETTEELFNRIRAFHPWLKTYFQYGNTFFVINPYNVEITDCSGEPGMVVDSGKCSLTVAAKDGKALIMSDLRLYRFPLLTKFFINAIGKSIERKNSN